MVVISSFPPPTEGIKHEQAGTAVVINGRDFGKGTIYIAESRLSWVDSGTGQGFSIEYPHVSIHAVSKDLNAFPEECLYLMLDTAVDIEETKEDEEGDEEKLTEVRFVPEDKSTLDEMYRAMNHCQALHPDPDDGGSDFSENFESGNEGEEDSDEEFFDMNQQVEGQFDDADGEPEN